MSRDYKPNNSNTRKSNKGSPFITGLLIGVLLGIGLSLLVIMFLKAGDSPFNENTDIVKQNPNKYDDLGKPKDAINNQATVDDKTRFDFYTILPGKEKQITSAEINAPKESATVTQNVYYLQVGAFQTTDEADNMKAKLALQGFETVVQTASIPDKGVWHRVRVGPLSDLDVINKTKSELAQSGFKADLIKMDSTE